MPSERIDGVAGETGELDGYVLKLVLVRSALRTRVGLSYLRQRIFPAHLGETGEVRVGRTHRDAVFEGEGGELGVG